MKKFVKLGFFLVTAVVVVFGIRTAYDLIDSPVVWHEVEPEG
ncbi:MAG: hypothetical protein WAS54_01920 [Scrofimicrobium sp.]